MTAEEERTYVLQTFQECMKPYKDKRIALYGLGVNSEYLIMHQKGYKILALLDGKRVGEMCFGLPVISSEEAICQVDVIVIVAKNESVPIIYDRIAWMEEDGMVITDIAGRVIVDKTDEELEKEPYWEKNYEHLLNEIDKYEVITFDIFDTILMRTILRPEDIFEVVAKKWCSQNHEDSAFTRKFLELRKRAQHIARDKYDAYDYDQIYRILKEISDFTDKKVEELKGLELETEKQFIEPRHDVVKALEYAYRLGKKVYLISDMYFRQSVIEVLLKKCEITQYHGIIVSSDAGCWKWPNAELFNAAIEKFGLSGKKVLHIGDNEGADWICGGKVGFDIYPIWSAHHMLEKSALKYLLVNVKTVEDSCMLGIYAAKYLNSPFALHEGKGKLVLKTEYDIGYAGYGALLTAYTHYLVNKYQGEKNTKIIFLARDGYLPHKLYEQIINKKKIEDAASGIYVLSSRRALAVPAIFNEEDLEVQLKRIQAEVKGGEFLAQRFGVMPIEEESEADKVLKDEELQNFVRKYKVQILKKAEQERTDYLKYLSLLGIDSENEKHILMESETSGTSAHYWRKFVQPKAEMEAILLLNITEWSLFQRELDKGFLGEDSRLLKRKAYCRSEILNDSILTSPDSQFMYINNQEPIFSEKAETKKTKVIFETQKGVEDFCREYLEKLSYPTSMQAFSTNFLDDFIRVLVDKSIVVDEVKRNFMVVEQFGGRMGEIYAWKTLE